MREPRVEWRGDVFAADLRTAGRRIRRLPIIPRPFEHTVTIFLHPDDGGDMDLSRMIRLRAYHDLPAISAEAIASVLTEGLAGMLQSKAQSGETRPLGDAVLRRLPDAVNEGAFSILVGSVPFRARSLRVSQRIHYSFAPGAAPPFDEAAETMRVTVDSDRHLFHLDGDGSIAGLGQLGPRIEIKGPSEQIVERLRRRLDPRGAIRRKPNRSLELLFQELLRRRVRPAPPGYPEIELKFELAGDIDDETILACLDAIGAVRLLLPPPHGIERMRRYHLCSDRLDSGECTIVETASGRLSTKRKRNPRTLGPVLLRDTIASRTTDRTGTAVAVEDFLIRSSLTRLASFEKEQTKIPFALEQGHAFLISFDHCFERSGLILNQVELEYIGTTGSATPSPVAVAGELEMLGNRLLQSPIGRRLTGSALSKFEYFSASAA